MNRLFLIVDELQPFAVEFEQAAPLLLDSVADLPLVEDTLTSDTPVLVEAQEVVELPQYAKCLLADRNHEWGTLVGQTDTRGSSGPAWTPGPW